MYTYDIYGKNNTSNLLCTWHLDRAWRKSLKEYIKNQSDRITIYYHLRVILEETDKAKILIKNPATLYTPFI